jgi:anti-sigma regulatory factor (Ser/Thr protein kinase)
MNQSLDFDTLDGLAFAAQKGKLHGLLPSIPAADLGPLIEFEMLSNSGLLPPPNKNDWIKLNGLSVLYREIKGQRRHWVCPEAGRIGFLRTEQNQPSSEATSIGFRLSAQKAAIAIGFPAPIARQLAAAMGELESNIYEHSGKPKSGLLAFRAHPNHFEFIAYDVGIGILDSIRTCADYSSIGDYGDALSLALKEGVSRFGANAGRGFGFRPIFVGLANLNGTLRFRSGDHALMIDGANPDVMAARVAQKPFLGGFLASIKCEIQK